VRHGFDLTTGLGLPGHPPADLCAAVLTRLFPDGPAGDPAAVLRWQTGRGVLPGRARKSSWVWRAAPAR
jgi:hypothetical protein